ncbi:MAG TPA: hypothetical protein VI603_11735 [Saprospiraceae bacterium]|nr:hypothetical protein [Saprospiraceae bacterium]
MKSLKLFSFLVVISLLACTQDNAFKQRHDTGVQSRSGTDDEEASDDATEEENEIEIDLSALPQNVVDAIAAAYPGATLREADKIMQNDGSVTYDVEIGFENESIELMYDAEGSFLGEEPEDD